MVNTQRSIMMELRQLGCSLCKEKETSGRSCRGNEMFSLKVTPKAPLIHKGAGKEILLSAWRGLVSFGES